ncbi:PREDICTED: 28S ribosomal protein S18c, mitochondrial-like [Priapulus caudatus]|uniref:28S ribosomal protein S18c, mitochondrial-like n=1 Tax=Priapulus caudatus TaxID=37621 RepID=A0ABM1EDX1_PRICU|nr:PREDICTED: 28S ribosomal protein S18c, mitochondrial-like [Priapulus caudatus]
MAAHINQMCKFVQYGKKALLILEASKKLTNQSRCFHQGISNHVSSKWVYGSHSKRRRLAAEKKQAEMEEKIEKMTKQMGDYPDQPSLNMENPYVKDKIECILCKHNIEVDYKNVRLLSQFVSPYTGRLYEQGVTGLCKHQYEKVVKHIKLARNLGYMPFMVKEINYLKDHRLFDPLHPKYKIL